MYSESGRFTGRRSFARSLTTVLALSAGVCLLRPGAAAHLKAALKVQPLSVIIVGGGPTPDHNQVAIESNVKYVTRLLPADVRRATLFADGDANNASVLYIDDVKSLPLAEQALTLALQGGEKDFTSYGHYRKPSIPGSLDGASSMQNVGTLLDKVAAEPQGGTGGLLLYFTGHGSPQNSNMENNRYDLWGKSSGLSVRELADQISHVPTDVPVTVVMAQCYSGAFGNLIFSGGNPANPYVDREIVGFYATTKDRVAAGCTPALNEADYHDFTSYFFAALTGQDRLGHKVTGADYNHDGHVGMDEAFCYTLLHDESVDVPVCTSDVMLRREIPFKIEEIQRTPYADIKKWASRAQRAALDGLSSRLGLSSEDRYALAIRMMNPRPDRDAQRNYNQLSDEFTQLRTARRRFLFSRWPDLKRSGTREYTDAKSEALAMIGREIEAGGEWKALIDAYDTREAAELRTEESENRAAAALRLARLCTSVILGHQLMQTGDADQKARYTRLVAAEHRPLLESPRAGSRVEDDVAVTGLQ